MTTVAAPTELSRLVEVGPGPRDREAVVRTFLLADVRGYTRFTEERGDLAAARLALRFAAITSEVVGPRDGRVIELRGDEALAVFMSSRQALRAALELQERFAHELELESSLPLGVGIGLDAGEAVPVKDGYRGRCLNIAARLCSLAKPGEVLLSETIVNLAGKMSGFAYLDRGRAQLKGLAEPLQVVQVVPDDAIPATVSRFVPDHDSTRTLPRQPSSFVGREQEMSSIIAMLQSDEVTLLTLLGPGGAGKTRLALEVASRLGSSFRDGVVFVSLASVRDPALVIPTIASALGLQEEYGHALIDVIQGHLADKRFLLILDNFEHLLAAALPVADLLARCPRLSMLVTSTASLRVVGEHEFPVAALTLPDLEHLPESWALTQFEAVDLFVKRARAVKRDFAVTNDNARAVAEICVNLDGLPLAIELAAARIRLFPPQALLARLSRRLTLLTGGARDLPQRQQTLRNTMEWSYSLLDDGQKLLFACLSCFSGGCRLEAAEAVCDLGGATRLDVLDGIASLIERSLLRKEQDADGEPRFVMLETIREYALERLAESGLENGTRRRHAEHYLAMTEGASPALVRQEPGDATDRLERDHDNCRSALRWCLDQGEGELTCRLVWGLIPFWTRCGFRDEARRWIHETIARFGSPPSRMSARMLRVAGALASMHGDHEQALALVTQALTTSRTLGDAEEEAAAFDFLILTKSRRGDYTEAIPFWEKKIAEARSSDDCLTLARYLDLLGTAARFEEDYTRASVLYEESLRLYRRLGHENAADELLNLGLLGAELHENRRAERLLAESLRLYVERGLRGPIVSCLDGFARIAAADGEAERAVRLWGAAEMLSARYGFRPDTLERSVCAQYMSRARGHLNDQSFAAAWQEGQTMEFDDTIRYALESDELTQLG